MVPGFFLIEARRHGQAETLSSFAVVGGISILRRPLCPRGQCSAKGYYGILEDLRTVKGIMDIDAIG